MERVSDARPILKINLPSTMMTKEQNSLNGQEGPAVLDTREEFVLSVKPYHTIHQLSKFITSQQPSVTSVSVYMQDGTELEKWSKYNTIEDVVSFALRVNRSAAAASSAADDSIKCPRLFIKFNNDSLSVIQLPSMEERLKPYQDHLSAITPQLAPLQELKQKCDKRASLHSSALVYGGLAGLMTQWTVLARLTWWDYSWDVIEPIMAFSAMGNSILAYVFFVVYKKDFSCEVLSSLTATNRQKVLYLRYGFDTVRYTDLVRTTSHLNNCIQEIKKMY